MAIEYVDIVFSGEHVSGLTFVEVENPMRESIRIGEWIERSDGYKVLRIRSSEDVDWASVVEKMRAQDKRAAHD